MGFRVGRRVGFRVGCRVGVRVGRRVGDRVGVRVGDRVGFRVVGFPVGFRVGTGVVVGDATEFKVKVEKYASIVDMTTVTSNVSPLIASGDDNVNWTLDMRGPEMCPMPDAFMKEQA